MNQHPIETLPQVPKWLHIAKVGSEFYRVIDTSVDAIGFHLGSFQTRQAATRFATKVAEARAEIRDRNRRLLVKTAVEAPPRDHENAGREWIQRSSP